MPRFVRGGLLVALLVLPTPPAHALMPCRPPSDLIVVYPASGATLSLSPTIFLRARGEQHPPGGFGGVLSLSGPGGASVELGVEPKRSSGLILVRPKQRLRPGAYRLEWTRPSSRGSPARSVEAPGWQYESGKLVLHFQARGAAVAGAPALASGAAEFSAMAAAQPTKGMIPGRGAGRYGHLTVRAKAGRPAPAVLELAIEYTGPQPFKTELPLAFAPGAIEFATLPIRCGHPLSLYGAPSKGRYAIEVTPWSANGVKGTPLALKGEL